jgi:hypothetical protein
LISIGGPPPSLFSFATSLPPFHVALSSTCASVSCSEVNDSDFRMAAATRSLDVKSVLRQRQESEGRTGQ